MAIEGGRERLEEEIQRVYEATERILIKQEAPVPGMDPLTLKFCRTIALSAPLRLGGLGLAGPLQLAKAAFLAAMCDALEYLTNNEHGHNQCDWLPDCPLFIKASALQIPEVAAAIRLADELSGGKPTELLTKREIRHKA